MSKTFKYLKTKAAWVWIILFTVPTFILLVRPGYFPFFWRVFDLGPSFYK